MAAPTTLKQFWTEEVARFDAVLTQAKADLVTATSAEAAATAALTQSSNDLRDTREALDAARKKLAGIPMPADGDPLLVDMRAALVAWRRAAAASVAADADVRRKRAQRQLLGARVASSSARLADANAALDAATKASDQRAAWAAAATSAPLNALPAAAAAAWTGFGTPAKTNVEGDFPPVNATVAKDFLTRVRERRALGLGLLAEATDVAVGAIAVNKTWEEKTTRESAKTPALRRAFETAVEKLRAFIDAPQKFAQADAAVKALANRPASPITPAQRGEIRTSVAALATSRANALAKLKTRDDAQKALFDEQAAYDKLLFEAQSADPDKTEAALLAVAGPLKTQHDKIAPKRTALTTAETDLGANELTARDLKQAELIAAQADYALALLVAQAANPGMTETQLLAAIPALNTKNGAVATKAGLLATAETALQGTPLGVLQPWFAAVPDVLWDQLDTLDAAQADLAAIQATNPAALVTDVTNTESLLAGNLDASSKEQRLIDALREGLAQRQVQVADEIDLGARRKQAAARFVAEV